MTIFSELSNTNFAMISGFILGMATGYKFRIMMEYKHKYDKFMITMRRKEIQLQQAEHDLKFASSFKIPQKDNTRIDDGND